MISSKNILNLELRREIYNYILNNPSSYVREISKKMEIPKTTLRHHLITLEKRELITSKEGKGFKRYYVANKLGKREKEILTILKRDIPRNILLYLMHYVVCSQLEISKVLEKNPATVSYHIKKLKELGLIVKSDFDDEGNLKSNKKLKVRKKIKREILYRLKDRETNYTLYNLLTICKDSVSDKELLNCLLFTDEAKEHFQKRIPKKHPLGIILTPEQEIDNVLKAANMFLPYPIF